MSDTELIDRLARAAFDAYGICLPDRWSERIDQENWRAAAIAVLKEVWKSAKIGAKGAK